MHLLKKDTATTVLVGPVLDATGAAWTGAAIGDFNLTKNGTTAAMAAAATATHSHNGHYLIALTTGNTDTLGRLTISMNKATYAMAMFRYEVLTAAAFDALVANGNVSTYAGGEPDNAGIAAIKAKTDLLPAWPANWNWSTLTAQQVWENAERTLTDKAGFGLANGAITQAVFATGVVIGANVVQWLGTTPLALSDQKVQAIADGAAASPGTGAYAVTITVTDGTNPLQNATVRLTEGGTSLVATTNASGVATFACDAATWSVAITKALYQFTPTTLVVSGNASQSYAMTALSVPAAPAGQVTLYAMCYNANGAVEQGVVIHVVCRGVSGTGAAYNGKEITMTSGANGLATAYAPAGTGMRFDHRRGDYGDWQTTNGVASGTLALTSMLGTP